LRRDDHDHAPSGAFGQRPTSRDQGERRLAGSWRRHRQEIALLRALKRLQRGLLPHPQPNSTRQSSPAPAISRSTRTDTATGPCTNNAEPARSGDQRFDSEATAGGDETEQLGRRSIEKKGSAAHRRYAAGTARPCVRDAHITRLPRATSAHRAAAVAGLLASSRLMIGRSRATPPERVDRLGSRLCGERPRAPGHGRRINATDRS
jgi:hypothetical protein